MTEIRKPGLIVLISNMLKDLKGGSKMMKRGNEIANGTSNGLHSLKTLYLM
jgi:hypothetical protein